MKYSGIAFGLALFIGAGAIPVPEASLIRLLAQVAAKTALEPIFEKQDGGRRYVGLEEWPHDKPPSARQLNGKVAQFYRNLEVAHQENPDLEKYEKPGVVAGQFHAKEPSMPGVPGHIAYSSTMAVKGDSDVEPHRGFLQPEAFVKTSEEEREKLLNKSKDELQPGEKKLQGKLKANETAIVNQTQPNVTVDKDPRKNFAKCAESGTCALIEKQYGQDVNMRGDKISAYGVHGIRGQSRSTEGHIETCTTANHKQFHCNGVAEPNGLDDVNRSGRSDSSSRNSPIPQSLSPVRNSPRPQSLSPVRTPEIPLSSGTSKHYEQSTASSRAKQRDKVVEHTGTPRRRALLRKAYPVG